MDNFQDIIKEYSSVIYKICRVYATDADFDDLKQEVLVNVWKSLKNFNKQSQLSTWIYRVALNTALTYQRSRSKNDSVSMEYIPELPEQSHSAERQEKIEILYNAIRRLESTDRMLILLYLDKKSYKEIEEITGLTSSNIGVKINRIKKKLMNSINSK